MPLGLLEIHLVSLWNKFLGFFKKILKNYQKGIIIRENSAKSGRKNVFNKCLQILELILKTLFQDLCSTGKHAEWHPALVA